MATLRLNDRRVDALSPRKSAYDARDRDLKGFGVRVMPSGAKRCFVHSQRQGRRVRKIVGDAGSTGTDEACDRAKTLMAAIQEGSETRSPQHHLTSPSRRSPTKSSGATPESGSRLRSR